MSAAGDASGGPLPDPAQLPLRRIAAAVVLRAGRVLVQTRVAGPWAGYWEFPGGGIESGEDASSAAVRECREELSLQARAVAPLHQVEWAYPTVRVHVSFILCDAAGEPVPLEGQEIAWAGLEELAQLCFLPANATVLELLRDKLRRERGDLPR
jgi:mutator protein MutT